MKRVLSFFAAALLLSGCAARRADARAEGIQARCAAADGYAARAEVAVVRGRETARYTLDVVSDGESVRVTVLAPEELSDVSAVLTDGARTLTFDGMALDAGSDDPSISALNATDAALRAAAEGWITEQNSERIEGQDALRLCFETERGGEPLHVAMWFDERDVPLCAELEHGGAVAAYIKFTDFAFSDAADASTAEQEEADDEDPL